MSHTIWTRKSSTGNWAVDVDDTTSTADITLNGKHIDNHPTPAPSSDELARSGYRLVAVTSSKESVESILRHCSG